MSVNMNQQIQQGGNTNNFFAAPLLGRERLQALQTSNHTILQRIKELQENIEENEKQVKSNLTELGSLEKHTKTANLFQAEFQKIVNVASGSQSLATDALVGILSRGVYCVSQRRKNFDAGASDFRFSACGDVLKKKRKNTRKKKLSPRHKNNEAIMEKSVTMKHASNIKHINIRTTPSDENKRDTAKVTKSDIDSCLQAFVKRMGNQGLN